MKVIYDPDTDTLSVVLKDTPVAESDEDKPGVISTTTKRGTWSDWRSLMPPSA